MTDRTTTRTAMMDRPYRQAYAWLKANGFDEWLPENPAIDIDPTGTQLTVDTFVWRDGALVDRWDYDNMVFDAKGQPRTTQRTVALNAPLTPVVREALLRSGARLTVRG